MCSSICESGPFIVFLCRKGSLMILSITSLLVCRVTHSSCSAGEVFSRMMSFSRGQAECRVLQSLFNMGGGFFPILPLILWSLLSLIPHSDLCRGRRGVLLVNLLLVVLMSRVSLSVCNVVGGGCLTSVPRVVFFDR